MMTRKLANQAAVSYATLTVVSGKSRVHGRGSATWIFECARINEENKLQIPHIPLKSDDKIIKDFIVKFCLWSYILPGN